ncbi:MAG: peptide ABC transporter substrate-binding protein [Gemmatimonadaceae bacterium]
MTNKSQLAAVVLAFVVAGCSRENDSAISAGNTPVGGTIGIAAAADADALVPPLVLSLQGKQVVDQIFDNLADIGPGLNTVGDAGFTPHLASSWRWSPDSLAVDFMINPRARWHDGVPVRAEDVRFTFGLVKNPALGSPLSSNLDNVDSVTTPDSMTARVWFHRRMPDEFFKAATPVPILPAHLLANIKPADLRASSFAQHPIGSGRFKFSSWERRARITLTADSANYRGRPKADRIVWLISADYPAAALRFLGGEADFLDVVKPEYIAQVRSKGDKIITTDGSLDYGYAAFNLGDATKGKKRTIFADRDLRRALVMAIDRNALVRNVFDTLALVAHGPATRVLTTSDTTLGLPYDTTRAATTFDSLGWKRGPDGMRRKAGEPLAFALMVPNSSAIRSKLAVLLQEQWRRVGAAVRIESVDANAFGTRLDDRKFQAVVNAWHIDPTPSSVREEWASSEIRSGGYNATSYSSPAFDAVIDSAVKEMDAARSVALYRRAYRILTDDAPAMWIYELRNVHGASPRINPVGIRADSWWGDLGDWSVNKRP